MLPILSSLLLVMTVGGGLHTNSVRAEETRASNTATTTAYWQRMLPNTPMPSAILDLLTPTDEKDDDQNFLFYGQAKTNKDQKVQHSYDATVKKDNQNFLFYGQPEKNDGKSTNSNVQEKKDDQNFLFYGQPKKNVDQNVRHSYGANIRKDDQNFLFYGQVGEEEGKATNSNGQEGNNNQNFLFYGQVEKNEDHKVQIPHSPTAKNGDQNFLFYGKSEKNDDKTTESNVEEKNEGHKVQQSYGKSANNGDQNFLFYGQAKKTDGKTTRSNVQEKNDDQNFLFYGQAKKNVNQKVRRYGPAVKNDDPNFLFYGQAKKNDGNAIISNVQEKIDDQNFLFYGEAEKNKDQQVQHGQAKKNDDKTTKSNVQEKYDKQNFLFYGQGDKNEERNVQHSGEPTVNNEKQNFLFYGQAEENKDGKNDKQNFLFYVNEEKNNGKTTKSSVQQEDGHKGEGGHMHMHGGGGGGITFSEDSVTPGSTIMPHILPSFTSGASLLPRHVAESIPISTRNFTGIMAMFAPVSSAMAKDIWSTLYLCDHPPVVKGETNTCVVSVESMVEFVSSVLGATHGLRALSSPDVPADGVKSGRRYRVTALRRVTGAGDTVTCHGLRFPSALFMCHAVNPTRVYSVTMERECADMAAPERLEALAVCHLETSDFDPAKMPGHFKPGEAPLCHFLASDNVLWAPPAAAAAGAA